MRTDPLNACPLDAFHDRVPTESHHCALGDTKCYGGLAKRLMCAEGTYTRVRGRGRFRDRVLCPQP
jgi:hypothetical protein